MGTSFHKSNSGLEPPDERIREALLFLKVSELRALSLSLGFVMTGKKEQLINRLLHFLKTGALLESVPFPPSAYAPKGYRAVLAKEARMFYKTHRHDLKTRLFFKQLIGPHFHFTAFGIDWLEGRWRVGKPPSYQEFAVMWEAEYQKRKMCPAPPKQEWAFIRFSQAFRERFPDTPRSRLLAAWMNQRKVSKAFLTFLCQQRGLLSSGGVGK